MYIITPAEKPRTTDNAFKLSLLIKKVTKPPTSVDIPANNVKSIGKI